MTQNQQIAQTILSQLGGRRFSLMTGAKNLVAVEMGLSFRIPRSGGVNYVNITVTPADLYDIEFGYIRGESYKVVHKTEGLFANMLCAEFTDITGLDTAMPVVKVVGHE